MRLTKIICTLGPSSTKPEVLTSLMESGMNIARINFSHGTQEGHRETIRLVKKTAQELGKTVALLLDTKGAEIRTGEVETPIEVKKGEEVVFASHEVPTDGRPLIRVNYDLFAKDVAGAEIILLENGSMPFDIVSIRDDGAVIGRSLDDCRIGSRRHINLPGADVSLPSMTDKDWSDLELGIEEKMDYVALSFIRTAEEVQEVIDFLRKRGSTMRVMAKIETRQAVADIDRIIDLCDGIMVARGDLGAEMPYEKIPAVQDMIVAKCREKATPVIVATQMLESMIQVPMPTRAEVTDVAHAAITRADMTMLSGETAAGQFPVLAVQAMDKILRETESHLPPERRLTPYCPLGDRSALAESAASMALTLKCPAIAVLTRSGKSALAVSAMRTGLPVIALTDSAEVQRSLLFCHGVIPLLIAFDQDPEVTMDHAFAAITEHKILTAGEKIVCVTDAKTPHGNVHAVHVRTVA